MSAISAPAQAAATISAPKKAAAPKPKAPKEKRAVKKAEHPAWANMMESAVKSLNEKGGTSIPAIKKYILANFKVDAEHITPHMRRGAKAALASGKLTQAKGHGLSGSFKLGAGKIKAAAPAKKTIKIKKAAAKKSASPKKASAKKAAKPKKSVGTPKVAKAGAKPKKASPKPKKAGAKAKKVTKKIVKKAPSPIKIKTSKKIKAPKAPKPKTTKKAATK